MSSLQFMAGSQLACVESRIRTVVCREELRPDRYIHTQTLILQQTVHASAAGKYIKLLLGTSFTFD